MRIIRQDPMAAVPDRSAIFVGNVLQQNIVSDTDAALLRVTSVTFQNGARNKVHHHLVDQVLVVTHGQGLIATDSEVHEVGPGDIVLIPAGERHWHGAKPGQDFTHLSILTPGATVIDEEGKG